LIQIAQTNKINARLTNDLQITKAALPIYIIFPTIYISPQLHV